MILSNIIKLKLSLLIPKSTERKIDVMDITVYWAASAPPSSCPRATSKQSEKKHAVGITVFMSGMASCDNNLISTCPFYSNYVLWYILYNPLC